MLDDLHDCYRTLDLEPGATPEEVKRSYRELVKVWHPDRFTGDPNLQRKAEENLKRINFAYERISKGEAAAPRRRTRSAQPSSSSTKQQAEPPGSQAGPKKEQAQEQSPPPKTEPRSQNTGPAEKASQKGMEPKWAHAACGFGFLALSLWLMPTIWNDFSKYEAGEGIRTTRKIFQFYQLLGKQGVLAFFLLFGLFMGYVGLCHARALVSGQQRIRVNLRKGHLITAAVALGFFVLIGDRPGRRTTESAPAYTQQSPNNSSQVPSVTQPQPKVREALSIGQITELHREALRRNPNLQMLVQEFSRYEQANQTEYDYSAGIAYSPPPEAPKQTREQPAPVVVSEPPVTSVPLASSDAILPAAPGSSVATDSKRVELAMAKMTKQPPIENRHDQDFFTQGSHKDDVIRLQGTPATAAELTELDAKGLAALRSKADQGDAAAQSNLGVMYAEGRGVVKSEAKAVKWYRKAADQGFAAAQANLGFMYAEGRGVVKYESEAVKWYRKAADQGYAVAQNNLGFMYAEGQGVVKDEAEAVKWYRKAVDQGFAAAQNNLGFMYAEGRGVVKDKLEAYKWYLLSGAQGDEIARENIPLIERNLTATQRAAGKKLARQFRPRPAPSSGGPAPR